MLHPLSEHMGQPANAAGELAAGRPTTVPRCFADRWMLSWEASHYSGSLPYCLLLHPGHWHCSRQHVVSTAAPVYGSISPLSVGSQHSVPCLQVSWQRVRVANWLAHTGEEWVRLLDTLNSGTYNNQYMARLAAACL